LIAATIPIDAIVQSPILRELHEVPPPGGFEDESSDDWFTYPATMKIYSTSTMTPSAIFLCKRPLRRVAKVDCMCLNRFRVESSCRHVLGVRCGPQWNAKQGRVQSVR